MLQRLVASYNALYHHSIGMSTNEVNASNEDHICKRLFPPKKKHSEHASTSNWATAFA